MKSSLFGKFLLALFLIALLPLAITSATLFLNLRTISSHLAEDISTATDRQASENLEVRARQIADDVAGFLEECENDLRLIASLPQSAQNLRIFYDGKQGLIWQRGATPSPADEVRKSIPRYTMLELIDRSGRQLIVIKEGRLLPATELRNVATPANTLYPNETYFREAATLKKGQIYVSHLTGYHLAKKEQLGNAPDSESAYGGREYRGVVRFATPLFNEGGEFIGVLALALDHRHLMEFSQHEQPGRVGKTVFPSYKSGNYAFIFDDEGWIITHPNYWDIRGLLPDGTPVPPYSEHSTPADIAAGRIPFNLDHAGFIHPNYPVAAAAVRQGKSGYLDTTNVGGAKKTMAYAPIVYKNGIYGRYGIFGGVTIGFQTDQFHEPARAATTIIHQQMNNHLQKSALILAVTTLLALTAAWRISRGITRPIALLAEQARAIAGGSANRRVEVTSGDEIAGLADDFNRMADELDRRNRHLLAALDELDHSRQEVTDERNLMEGVVNSISSGIIPFSKSGLLISINTKGGGILGGDHDKGEHYATVFAQWPELVARIDATVAGKRSFGREPFTVDGHYYDVGIFPIGLDMEQGITVTIRDETEKERMREEMTRMDRFASLGKLSAGIAHEIRNPITGITLLLDDLHDRSSVDAESREMLGKAMAEIERVEKLINALLSYAAPPRSEFIRGDIGAVIESTLLFFRKACEKAGVALVSRVETVPGFVFDADKIRQMLLNLLRNALMATEAGGTITVTAGNDAGLFRLVVSDTGQGIPADDIDKVFEPFFTRSRGGTGLGLSITQRIVQEHHGSIAVSSVAGEGTTFTVMLPLAEETEDLDGKDTDH